MLFTIEIVAFFELGVTAGPFDISTSDDILFISGNIDTPLILTT